MKKYIFLLLIMPLLLTGCSTNPVKQSAVESNNVNETNIEKQVNIQVSAYNPTYENISLKTDEENLTEISKEIFDIYLTSFTEEKVTDSARISDYKIELVKVEKGSIDNFQFYVEYSIYPSSSLYILAGNGEKESDGWVRRKAAFVNVKKEDNLFKIQGIGTGP